MTVVMMRATAKPEHVEKIESAAEIMFEAIKEEGLKGIRYVIYRVGDTPTFVVLLEVQDGIENPLPTLAAVKRFQETLQGGGLATQPSMEQLSVVGDYRSL